MKTSKGALKISLIQLFVPEEVVVASSHNLGVVSVPATLKLIEDAIIFIQGTQFGAQIFVDCVRLDWFCLHVKVPDFDRQIIPGNNPISLFVIICTTIN